MLQNWEARPFRGYYGSGRIAIGGFTSCERGSRSLGQMTLSKPVLAGNTSSPAFDHLQDNLWRFTNATTVTMQLNQLERTHIKQEEEEKFRATTFLNSHHKENGECFSNPHCLPMINRWSDPRLVAVVYQQIWWGCRSGFGGGGHADKRSPCSEVTNACPILKKWPYTAHRAVVRSVSSY